MPRPIADWRNPDAAEYPKRGARLSPNRWAWEFLRRNPDYQAAWQSCQEIVEAIMVDMGNESCQEVVDAIIAGNDAPLVEDDPRFSHYEPERKAGEDHAAWLTRVKHGRMTPMDVWIATEWGLKDCTPPLPSPYATRQYMCFSSSSGVVRRTCLWDTSTLPPLQPQGAFVIDFRNPIDGQIEALRRYAKGHQKSLITHGVIEAPVTINERPEWPLYLRLLDAELEGITDPGKLAGVFFPGESNEYSDDYRVSKKIEKAQERARQLREGGYLWIAAIKTKSRKNSGT